MACSLLRLGRLGSLKCLRQDGWGCLRTPLTAAFCTKTEAPKKPTKKASSKIDCAAWSNNSTGSLEASDERAALLASKTTVAFPTRLSTPGFLSQGVVLGEYEQSGDLMTDDKAVTANAASAEPPTPTPQVSDATWSEEIVTTADAKQAELVADDSTKAKTESYDGAEATPIVEAATEKNATSPTSADVEAPKSQVEPKDDATSSSSSSSDSDSDSDSDDEKPDKTEMTEPGVQTKVKAEQEEVPLSVSKDVKARAVSERVQPSAPEGAIKVAPEVAKAVSAPRAEKMAVSTTVAKSEKIVHPETILHSTESIKAQPATKPEKETSVDGKSSSIPKPVTEGLPDTATTSPEPKVGIKATPEMMEAVTPAEELVDHTPIITDAEEVQAKPEVTPAPEEAAAAPAPEPEPEPFDNTKYKNLQHHNYNYLTFVDMDVEMAKHRLPQPSTGRTSPRH